MKVCKFGGTSLASAGQVEKVFNIITADPARRVVVVSAPGKRFKEDTKVTDMLINCVSSFLLTGKIPTAEIEAVADRFRSMAVELRLSDETPKFVARRLTAMFENPGSDDGILSDSVKAMGEDFSARLVAEYFNSQGVKARYLDPKVAGLYLSEDFGNAVCLPESFENLRTVADFDGITIFPGFYGYTHSGHIATFSRGGSDITGAILAASVNAELYENFTDVDSVFAVNPNIVKSPRAIPEYTYREMRELAYMGFSVLHEDTLAAVYKTGIVVNIKNTNNPEAPGTFIVPERRNFDERTRVTGIASANDFVMIDVTKYMMNREIGFGRRLLQILEEEKISYEHTPSGIDSISVIFRGHYASPATLSRIVDRIYKELGADDINIKHDICLISVVGEGMKKSVGFTARASLALARAGVNIELLNQGASEISILFGIHSDDEIKAVRAIYNEFFG
ncbi:MAG: aspartate kinase [Clostridia bacterium]|nr:aspartate kinase [Clostridia bacterium]